MHLVGKMIGDVYRWNMYSFPMSVVNDLFIKVGPKDLRGQHNSIEARYHGHLSSSCDCLDGMTA